MNAAQHPAAAEKGAENATAAAAAEKRITTDTDETQKTAAICIMRLFIGPGSPAVASERFVAKERRRRRSFPAAT